MKTLSHAPGPGASLNQEGGPVIELEITRPEEGRALVGPEVVFLREEDPKTPENIDTVRGTLQNSLRKKRQRDLPPDNVSTVERLATSAATAQPNGQ